MSIITRARKKFMRRQIERVDLSQSLEGAHYQPKKRMTFRPATEEEKLRLKGEKLEDLWSGL